MAELPTDPGCCKFSRAAHMCAELGATPISSLMSVTHLVRTLSVQKDSAFFAAHGVMRGLTVLSSI